MKIDERNQNIKLKHLHGEYVVARFLLFMVLSSGHYQELGFTWKVYMFSFEIIFFQKFIQNVIPRMLQVVQELIPVDEVIKLFFARTVFNLFFLILSTFLFIKRNLHLSVNLTFVGPSMWVIGGFRWNVGMWSLHYCSSH